MLSSSRESWSLSYIAFSFSRIVEFRCLVSSSLSSLSLDKQDGPNLARLFFSKKCGSGFHFVAMYWFFFSSVFLLLCDLNFGLLPLFRHVENRSFSSPQNMGSSNGWGAFLLTLGDTSALISLFRTSMDVSPEEMERSSKLLFSQSN